MVDTPEWTKWNFLEHLSWNFLWKLSVFIYWCITESGHKEDTREISTSYRSLWTSFTLTYLLSPLLFRHIDINIWAPHFESLQESFCDVLQILLGFDTDDIIFHRSCKSAKYSRKACRVKHKCLISLLSWPVFLFTRHA